MKKLTIKHLAMLASFTLILAFSLVNRGSEFLMEHTFETDDNYRIGKVSILDTYSLPKQRSASAGDIGGGRVYVKKDSFLSKWTVAEVPFHALEISWNEEGREGTDASIFVRTRKLNGRNSKWMEVLEDIDGPASEKHFSFLRTAWSTQIQYRLEMTSNDTNLTPEISNLEFTYIDATAERSGQTERSEVPVAEEESPLSKEEVVDLVAGFNITDVSKRLPIISRNQWGADESLRVFKGFGKPKQLEVDEEILEKYGDEIAFKKEVKRNAKKELLIWPVQYPKQPIKTIFIHHTASQEDAMKDSYAAMRAIYYYHTVSRGWGDIGYNYLIDEDGNVFEGRYGGETVVGAHTANFNVGSIGVAVIGNYEENELKYGAFEGLLQLLSHLTDKYNLDPTAITTMRGKNLHVISGHRDAGKTTCPGQFIYEKLTAIRQLVKGQLTTSGVMDSTVIGTEKGAVDFEDPDKRGVIVLGPEEKKTIRLKLKNIGTKTWTRSTSLVYKNGQNNVAGFKETVGNLKQSQVRPGDSATFEIPIQGTFASGLKNYYLYVNAGGTLSQKSLILPVYMEPAEVEFELVRLEKTPKMTLSKNESTRATFMVKNMGNITWTKQNAAFVSTIRGSLLADSKMVTQAPVKPGSSAIFEASFKSGATAGQFTEKLKLVVTDAVGNKVRSRDTQDFTFRVKGKAKIKGDNVIMVDKSADLIFEPGEKKRIWVEVLNNSNEIWNRTGVKRMNVAFLKAANIKISNVLIERAKVKPGESVKVQFELKAPEKPGKKFVNLIFRDKDKRYTKVPIRLEFAVKGERTDPPEAGKVPVARTQPVPTPTPDPIVISVRPKKTENVSREKIRVALSFQGNPVITSDSNLRIYDSTGDHLNAGIPIPAGTKISITNENRNYRVKFGNRDILTSKYIRIGSDNGILKIKNFEHRPAWNTSLNDNEYRGVLEVRVIDGQLKVINELPLEDYLKGLGEVSNGDPTEKMKTIVVIARSYALYYMSQAEKFPGKPYHLDDNPNVSQRYLGYGLQKRSPNLVKAVDATSRKVVTYRGEVIKTPYFNSTDGTATKSAEEVWGWTNTPYLVSVPDPLCEATAFNGHGVGLSGCGATAAAQAGKTFEQVIKYYYTGVELQTY